MKPIERNSVALLIAVLAALVAVAAPIVAIFAVWYWSLELVLTAAGLLVLALVLYFIAQQVWDDEPVATARR